MIRVRSQSLHKLKHNISTLMWYDGTMYQAITVRKTNKFEWNLYKEAHRYYLLAEQYDLSKACLFRLDMHYSKQRIAYPRFIYIGKIRTQKCGLYAVKAILTKNSN